MTTPTPSRNSQLRAMTLDLTPEKIEIALPATAHGVWGVVMDTSFEDEGAYTAVALIDGNASIYIGDQSGVIGGFAHPSVRQAAIEAVGVAEQFASEMRPAEILPLPQPAHTRFYLLAREGRLASAEIPEDDLGQSRHALAPLFHSMHRVIAELRKVSEDEPPGT